MVPRRGSTSRVNELGTYIGEASDELMSVGFLTCPLNQLLLPFFRFVFPLGTYETMCNIVEDGVIEKKGLLLN
jgi:hypothetical protein